MEQLSTDDLRRRQPETLRRVIAGDSFELTTYGATIGACVVPATVVARLAKLEDMAARFIWEESGGEPHPPQLAE